jgi:endoglucanase
MKSITLFKQYLILIGLLIILAIILMTFFKNNVSLQSKPIMIGLFSKNNQDYELSNYKSKHIFTVWGKEFDDKQKNYWDVFSKNSDKDNPNILTLEPWPQFGENSNRELLLSNIRDDKYHDVIRHLCTSIENNSKSKLILRWGHEMELWETSRYPWASKNSELYIQAYQKWVDTCRIYSKKILYMFSPASNNGQEKYYPGDSYVDYIGMSWYSYPAYEWYTYKEVYNFYKIMDDKYNRLVRYNKPIIAAEFGVAGSNDHKKEMLSVLKNKKELKAKYPNLVGITLFNDKTESWVPGVIESPDWVIPDEVLKEL